MTSSRASTSSSARSATTPQLGMTGKLTSNRGPGDGAAKPSTAPVAVVAALILLFADGRLIRRQSILPPGRLLLRRRRLRLSLQITAAREGRTPPIWETERSMRSIWKGTISFGLVNIPIALGVATQRSDPKFRTLDAETRPADPPADGLLGARRRRRRAHRDHQGLRGRQGPVRGRHRRGARERRGRAPAHDRHRLVHRHRRGRPGLLRPHLLRRPAGGREQALHAAARGAQADRQGRGRQVRPLEQGAPRAAAPVGRRARDRAPLLPRGRARSTRRRSRRSSTTRRSRRPSSTWRSS